MKTVLDNAGLPRRSRDSSRSVSAGQFSPGLDFADRVAGSSAEFDNQSTDECLNQQSFASDLGETSDPH